jgi:hypothetical protein
MSYGFLTFFSWASSALQFPHEPHEQKVVFQPFNSLELGFSQRQPPLLSNEK